MQSLPKTQLRELLKLKKSSFPAPAVSVVATTEFPRPPVVAVEAARVPANPELIAAAVPPPANQMQVPKLEMFLNL